MLRVAVTRPPRFFLAHAFKEAFRKDRGCSAEKGTAKKEEGEQRQKEKRIFLRKNASEK